MINSDLKTSWFQLSKTESALCGLTHSRLTASSVKLKRAPSSALLGLGFNIFRTRIPTWLHHRLLVSATF